MIRLTHPAPNQATTSEAHVRSVAAKHDLSVTPAGGYLYAIRTPLLGAPIVYRARVS